ncbi:MAG: aminoacyl-tRNA hydrolase [Puniceicoccaceae bacterium]|nr:MAG: aminoacyl-tRNA hydrolase [Puniceicoccaceae bacterium]
MHYRLVAGLGNPGLRYVRTRHNVGFVLLDALAARHGASWRHEKRFEAEVARLAAGPLAGLWLAKPLTYVNESGRCLQRILAYHGWDPAAAVIVYDEINLPTGRLKISLGGSAGGHNGIADLLAKTGDGFVRFRLGIGPRTPPEIDLKDFVLGRFPPEQAALLQERLPAFLDGLELLVDKGAEPAMNLLNRKSASENA